MPQAAASKTSMPAMRRAAEFQPSTFDPEKRTIDVCFTTGSKGKRWSYNIGTYIEELEVSDAAVKLTRLNNGAAVLDTHGQWRLADQFGVVEKAWVKDGKGYATLRFSDRDDVAGIIRDIENGIIRNISVGYIVHKLVDVSGPDDKIRTFRATEWEPCEISFVPVPFDAGAQVRSAEQGSGGDEPLFEVEIIESARAAGSNGEREMPPENQAPEGQQQTNTAPTAAQLEQAERKAVEAERARISTIQDVARRLGLKPELAAEHVGKGTSVEAFRTLAIDARATADEASATRSTNPSPTVITRDEHETRAQGIENMLLHRASPTVHKLDDNGKRFFGRRLVELCRMHLEAHGVRTEGMAPHQIASKALAFRSGMHSTSDFPYITANVANKSLLASYDKLAARATWAPLARQAFTPDFKTVSRVRRGEAPNLVVVPQGAEITLGSFGESREQYAIATYARRLAITEETIVNDDLGAFTSLPSDMGLAAARLESDLVWAQITSNPAMGDGTQLFHADHDNLASGAAISIAAIAAMEAAMMLQTGLDSNKALNIEPRYLIVPVALKATAEQFVSQNLLASEAGKVNPYSGKLQPIAEGRLDAVSASNWFLSASPEDGVDVLETLRLEGTSGPVVEMKEGWEVNGVELKVKHYFAAKALDWRGLQKNPN